MDLSGVHVSGEGKWGHCDGRSCRVNKNKQTNRKIGTIWHKIIRKCEKTIPFLGEFSIETCSNCCGTNVVTDREREGIRWGLACLLSNLLSDQVGTK